MASAGFEHVDKVYPGGTQAIWDLSLTIKDGELIVFVGPSGCGKSTLLRLLAGLEEITRGTLWIDETIVNTLSPQARNIAMVFQDYALYPHLSVRGNLEFPLKMRKLPSQEIKKRIQWVAELLGMTDWLERLPKQLSGGQRQRVAMGRALVREPTVFLLDEPLSNLDAKLRVQVRTEIGELQRRTGTTMIYVTHDQVEAMTLGDRVAAIHQGRLQQVAPPQMLYERPGNVFVAGFIGNPPMNLFPTRLSTDQQGQMFINMGDQGIPLLTAPAALARLRAHQDQPLTGGIRPESIRLAAGESQRDSIQAVVEAMEYLGHETLVYLRAGQGYSIVARLPGMQAFAKAERLRLEIDSAKVYLFDSDGKLIAD
jgi:multiple sugar transport system ATP-binding protein